MSAGGEIRQLPYARFVSLMKASGVLGDNVASAGTVLLQNKGRILVPSAELQRWLAGGSGKSLGWMGGLFPKLGRRDSGFGSKRSLSRNSSRAALKEDSGRGDAEAQMHAVAFGALSLREALGDDDPALEPPLQCESSRFARFRSRWSKQVPLASPS